MAKVTNFYSIKKLSQNDKDYIKEMINSDKILLAERKLSQNKDIVLFGELVPNEQFVFYNNKFKYYEPTRESIDIFLNDENRNIFNNEGILLTSDDIWKLVDETKDMLNNHIKAEEMDEGEKELELSEEYEYYARKPEIAKYNPEYGEFFNDNLRFNSLL